MAQISVRRFVYIESPISIGDIVELAQFLTNKYGRLTFMPQKDGSGIWIELKEDELMKMGNRQTEIDESKMPSELQDIFREYERLVVARC